MRRATVFLTALTLLLGAAAPAIAQQGSVGIVDTSTGEWYLLDLAGNTTKFFYGDPGDLPMVGDWDCDGDETPGLYRQSDGFVYLRNSNSQGDGLRDLRMKEPPARQSFAVIRRMGGSVCGVEVVATPLEQG